MERAIPQPAVIFLAKFDVKQGNSIVWSRELKESSDSSDGSSARLDAISPAHSTIGSSANSTVSNEESLMLRGLEFRALPSGLHESQHDIIYLAHNHPRLGLLYGIAVYRRSIRYHGTGSSPSRDDIKMYSLGVLYHHELPTPFHNPAPMATFTPTISPEHSVNLPQSWKYVSDLETLQIKIIQSNTTGVDIIDKYVETYSLEGLSESGDVGNIDYDATIHQARHPMLSLVEFLKLYQAQTFNIWKSVMVRDRILLLNSTRGEVSVEKSCLFVHILCTLGIVPADVRYMIPESKQHLCVPVPLYNVSVSDYSWLLLNSPQASFICTSTDDILMYKHDLYDTLIETRSRSKSGISVWRSGTKSQPTARDLRRYQSLVESLGIRNVKSSWRPMEQSQDGSRINHRSCWDWVSLSWDKVHSVVNKNLFSAILWWASAGENESADDADETLALLSTSISEPIDRDQNLKSPRNARRYQSEDLGTTPTGEYRTDERFTLENREVLAITGYFHNLTRRLFTVVSSAVHNQQSLSGNDPFSTVVQLDTTDLLQIGLDPLSEIDRKFIMDFVKVWYDCSAEISPLFSSYLC